MIMPESLCRTLTEEGVLHSRGKSFADYTSFKLGGNCAVMVFPSSMEQLLITIKACQADALPTFFFGNGSNLLVSDAGYDGVAIRLGEAFASLEVSKTDPRTILATAGTSLSKLCHFACAQGLTGLEFCYGIPAFVGGAIYMNAGAYGGEIKDVLQFVEYLDAEGILHQKSVETLAMSYRHSYFADHERAGGAPHCITKAAFRLTPGNPEEIKARMTEIYQRRRDKQPLEYPSAGSTFKRPQGAFAAALIEECGLKGTSVGGAQVSEKHSGFVINRGGATCDDVQGLIAQIKQVVLEQTGFQLEEEIKYIPARREDGGSAGADRSRIGDE